MTPSVRPGKEPNGLATDDKLHHYIFTYSLIPRGRHFLAGRAFKVGLYFAEHSVGLLQSSITPAC